MSLVSFGLAVTRFPPEKPDPWRNLLSFGLSPAETNSRARNCLRRRGSSPRRSQGRRTRHGGLARASSTPASLEALAEEALTPLLARAVRLGVVDDVPEAADVPLAVADLARADHRPSRGRKRSTATYYRWFRRGLAWCQVGASRRVTLRALAEHYARLTLAARGNPGPEPGSVRSPARRDRDLARANREAEALGV